MLFVAARSSDGCNAPLHAHRFAQTVRSYSHATALERFRVRTRPSAVADSRIPNLIVKMEHDREARHEFRTARLTIRLVDADDAEELIAYERRNRVHLAPWEPHRDPLKFENSPARRMELARLRAEAVADRTYAFGAREAGGAVVAKVTLSNVVRGSFQACHLGYSVDGAYEGKSIAFEAVGAVVRFAFEELRLHRVMANHQTANQRSSNLLSRLGFEVEGFARNYLYVDREWRDHVLTAIINPDPAYAPP